MLNLFVLRELEASVNLVEHLDDSGLGKAEIQSRTSSRNVESDPGFDSVVVVIVRRVKNNSKCKNYSQFHFENNHESMRGHIALVVERGNLVYLADFRPFKLEPPEM